MTATRPSARLLRNGVSVAALVASAWGLPTAAQAQSCTLGTPLDGLSTGTVVTCPAGTQLIFPGGTPAGQFTIPNSSTITGLAVGTSPTHQGWNYNDPNGNAFTVFLQGIYNLNNGVGGTTVLQGPALQTLSGAGACGTGGLVCPGNSFGLSSQVNVSPGGGGGVQGGFEVPGVDVQPGAGSVVNYSSLVTDGQFEVVDTEADSTPVYDSNGNMVGFYVEVDRQDLLDNGYTESEADEYLAENARLGQLLREGHGPRRDFLYQTVCGASSYGSGCGGPSEGLDVTVEIDPAVVTQLEDCSASGGGCVVVFFPDGAERNTFNYGPVIDTSSFDPSSVPTDIDVQVTITGTSFSDYLFTDAAGLNVYFADSPTVATGTLAGLLQVHEQNSATLAQQNVTGAGGAGAQGTFSIPSADGSFLFTGNGITYVAGPTGGNGLGFQAPLLVVPLDGAKPAVTIALVQSVQDSKYLPSGSLTSVSSLFGEGQRLGMGPIAGKVGVRTSKVLRPGEFIILPPDATPPDPTNLSVPSYTAATKEDFRPGAVVYNSLTGVRIGVITNEEGHVLIDDDPAAVIAAGLSDLTWQFISAPF